MLCASTGIEASDLSSLLEQFEKSEGEGTWVALFQPLVDNFLWAQFIVT